MLALLATGCPGSDPPTARPPPQEQQPTDTSAPTATPATSSQPLVLAINLHRAPLDVPLRLAHRIADGQPVTWRRLGQPGRRVVVRTGPHALDAVEQHEDVLAVVPARRLRPTVQAVTVGSVDPLRTPESYPLSTAGPAPAEVTTMTVVGDIMLGRGVAAAQPPGDPAAPLRPLRRRLDSADITVGNLESTLSQAGPPQQGGESFAADPAVLGGLSTAGFDLLTLANNHTGDYGQRALLQTVRRVRHFPIAPLGAGRDAQAAWRPVVVRRHGVRFGFVAFNAIGETPRATATSPGAAEVRMPPRTGPLNRPDLRRLTGTIRRLARRVDVVVALPHWGDQYTHVAVPAQRAVGRAMVDAGADLVVGEHPHWTQGVQVRSGRPIVNCLGNFVFDMDFSAQTQRGAMLELVFWGERLMGLRFVPYRIGPDFAPRPVEGRVGRAILGSIWRSSDPPYAPTGGA